jgi:hypothetical protein
LQTFLGTLSDLPLLSRVSPGAPRCARCARCVPVRPASSPVRRGGNLRDVIPRPNRKSGRRNCHTSRKAVKEYGSGAQDVWSVGDRDGAEEKRWDRCPMFSRRLGSTSKRERPQIHGRTAEPLDLPLYRSRKIATTTTPASTRVPRMYLFLESHDCEGARPALSTNSGDVISEIRSSGASAVSRTGAIDAGTAVTVCPSAAFGPFPGDSATAPLEPANVDGMGAIAGADCAAAAKARASALGAATATAAAEITGAVAEGPGFMLRCASNSAIELFSFVRISAPERTGSSFSAIGEAAGSACRATTLETTFRCPRHFFSSHSTQSARPADTGKPQASHFRRPLNTGGTWLWSASSRFPASPTGFAATDQNRFFFGCASAEGAGETVSAFSCDEAGILTSVGFTAAAS